MIPDHAEIFSFLKSHPEESIVKAEIRFLIGQKKISAALLGPSNIAELEECVAAADKEYTVTEEMLAALSGKLKNELNTLCTGCACCDECPENIPNPKLMDSYNEYLLETDYGKVTDRLKNHWGITVESSSRCIQCGKCETLCTQKLPIMARLSEMSGF